MEFEMSCSFNNNLEPLALYNNRYFYKLGKYGLYSTS